LLLGHFLEEVEELGLGELVVVVAIGETDEGLGVENAHPAQGVVAAQREAHHLGHLQQLQLPVLVLVELHKQLLHHHPQLLVAHTHNLIIINSNRGKQD
jgi:hypothetical protein